ncbi:hypothetical protein [Massilia sp. CF038]|uniref:hypothetical protein n=1 Tax=Massilia sp. CF038 TaxID=1881045 RepID=UPI00091CAFE3|nr:hypothetical protein [Massilia sp. CF038]SHG44066.1 hypothetical protein SAMN05428948_0495 [Massilia sp. CF038]
MKNMIAALGMLALAGAAQAGGAMQGMNEQVQVASSNGKVVVTLTVHNGGKAPLFVSKALYQATQLFGRVFDITEQGAGEIDYIGPMVKRGPYTKDDYLKVLPGAKLSHSMDITRSYAFKPGTHTYQLSYGGHVVNSLSKLDQPTTLAVAPVTFTHTAK